MVTEAARRVDSLAMFYTSITDGINGVVAFREKREACFTGEASDMPPFYEEWLKSTRCIGNILPLNIPCATMRTPTIGDEE